MTLRELLIQYELQNDLNHADVAKLVGVSLSTYYRWINGESINLKKSTIKKLSSVLNCDVENVIDESNRIKPILGNVKAGYDLWAEQDIDGYIELGYEDARQGDYFLRVSGDSMEGVHIYDGDLLYIQKTDYIQDGQVGIVMIGDEVTVKRVYFKNRMMILYAENPNYPPRFFSEEEIATLPVKVIGLVRYVRRDLV